MAASVNYLIIPGGAEINLRLVVGVSPLYSGQYTVYLAGHHETISDSDLPRSTFVSAWKAAE